MDKTCANHPESLAIGSCKSCDKALCLMCMQDEKEGTFCSDKCVQVYREVSQWVDAGSPGGGPPASAKPAPAPAAPPPQDEVVLSPNDAFPEPEPAHLPEDDSLLDMGKAFVACYAHPSAKAASSCRHCSRAICASCIVETEWGKFCSDICAEAAKPAPAPAPEPASAGAPSSRVEAPLQEAASSSSSALTVLAVVAVLMVAFVVGIILLKPEDKPGPTPPPVAVNPPPKVDPPKVDPPKPLPVAVTPPKVDPPKVDPPKVEPPKVEPPKVDPPKVEPPKPVVVAPPPVVEPPKVEPPKPGKIVNPWGTERVGSWYRVKTVKGVEESFEDVGLKERGPGYYVLAGQKSEKGAIAPAAETRLEPGTVSVAGETNLSIEGKSWFCEMQETGEGAGLVKTWVLRQGRHAGAILKSEGAGKTYVTNKIWEHTITVKGRTFECLVVEGHEEAGGFKNPVKTWFCAAFPLGVVKTETMDGSRQVVDLGGDWAKRPSLPGTAIAKVTPPKVEPPKIEPPKPVPPKPEPPKPEPPKPEPPKPEPPKPVPPKPEPPKPEDPALVKVKKELDDAAKTVRDAAPLVQAVKAADPLPSGADALKGLLDKATQAEKMLGGARLVYLNNEEAAPDPASVRREIKGIGEQLTAVREKSKRIKEALAQPPKPEPPKPEPPKPEPPKPEPPKPEPPKEDPAAAKAKKEIEDAGRMLREATPLYQDVIEAEPLPKDPDALKALGEKAAKAETLLAGARQLYQSNEKAAPDPAVSAKRITALGELLTTLRAKSAKIKEATTAKPEPPKPEPPKPVPPKPEPPKPEPPKPVPPKPEPPKEDPAAKAKREIDEAVRMIREATPLYGDVMVDTLPADKGELRTLLEKAKKAESLLTSARQRYQDNDPAGQAKRITQISELLEDLRRMAAKLEEALK